jgi:thymidine kinase
VSRGSIEVITGCMFSGKSEELSRRLRRAVIAKKRVLSIKHSSDNRYDSTAICSHAGTRFPGVVASTTQEVREQGLGFDVVGIDEGQFFAPALIHVSKLTAIFIGCGEPATRTFHKAGKADVVEVGADAYEARCRHCWQKGR